MTVGERIIMNYSSRIKNVAPAKNSQGPVQYKIAADVLESIERESPLHGLVIRSLVKQGEWVVVDL